MPFVKQGQKPPGFWTPERKQAVWDMRAGGKSFADIAKEFDTTMAAVQRIVYNAKKAKTP